MNKTEIIDIFESELGHADGRVELTQQIGNVEQSIKGRYWRISHAVSALSELYQNLNSPQRSSILDEKKELEQLSKREENQRARLRSKTENAIGGKSSQIIHAQYTADFIRRAVARRNVQAREITSRHLSSVISDLNDNLYNSNFDPTQTSAIISSNNRQRVRDYAADFAWHLICKGWNQDDMDNLGRRMRNTSKNISDYVANLATQSRNRYRYLIFIPNIKLDPPKRRLLDNGNATLYPSDYLQIDNLYKNSQLSSQERDSISEILRENSCIGLSVTAYARREAAQIAINRTHEVLDVCSYVHQQSDLRLPEYTGPFKRIRWNLNSKSPPLREMSYKSNYPAILDETRATTADQVYQVAITNGELPARLSRALRLFRRSNQSGPTVASVIDQVACLETLVSQGESNRNHVIDSAITLAGITEEDQHRITSNINILYDKRNAALHSGETKIDTPEVIERAQKSLQNILSAIIGRISEYIDHNPKSDMDSFLDYVDKEIKHRYKVVSWKLYRDTLVIDRNYRLEGEFVNDSGQRIADVQGSFRVENPDQHFVFECDYRLRNRSSNSVSSRERVWLNARVKGKDLVLGPVSGAHSMFSETSRFSVRDYSKQ
ncbi:hypothetical protein [Halococcus saccharolyticus]|uniref:hypothetical protein n=1 Tax=Halococcus saccharolyticus TaxID=62319 RepID=UPI000A80674B|nr:hypothetical protein [Halococcus saccharolyticus]